MSQQFTYHIFISHAWKYSDDYNRLIYFLESTPSFSFSDYSINEKKSLTAVRISDLQIRISLENQIKHASVVLVPLGMYATYHEWIQEEVNIAIKFRKPIIGVIPWGQEKLPQEVKDKCTEIVGWNSASIISAIKKYG